MRRSVLAAAVAACLAGPAGAQQVDPALATLVDKTVGTAITEWRVLLNCSATNSEISGWVRSTIDDMRRETAEWLRERGFRLGAVEAFLEQSDPENLLMREASFAEVIALCETDPDWMRHLRLLTFTRLPDAFDNAPDGS